MKTASRILSLAALVAFVAILSGCATDDPSNRAERPWTQRQSWEGGLPMGLNEGR